MVESIDDSRLKVTMSINRPNVREKVICEYMYCMHAGNVSDQRKVIIELDHAASKTFQIKKAGDPPPYKPSPSYMCSDHERI